MKAVLSKPHLLPAAPAPSRQEVRMFILLRFKWVLVMAALVGAVFIASTQAATKKPLIAAVLPSTGDPYWVSVTCQAKKRAAQLGYRFRLFPMKNIAIQDAQTAMNAALLTKPDGLIALPISNTAFNSTFEGLMKKGVPVVTDGAIITPPVVRRDIETSTVIAEMSALVAKYVGNSGSVGIVAGIVHPVIDGRWKPIVAAINKVAPGVNVLDTQYDNFDTNKASQIASALMLAHPDLKAIYTTSGPEGEGVAAAVQQAGKAGRVGVFAFDATPGEVAALKAGSITALVAQAPGLLGARMVNQVGNWLSTHARKTPVRPGTPNVLYLPLKVLTKANINTPAAQLYTYSASC
jgi:ribose transport system substrate-binding protein